MFFTTPLKARFAQRFDPTIRDRRRGFLRVAVFSSCTAALLIGVYGHHAKAQAEEKTIEVGRELSRISKYLGDGLQLRVNGQELVFAHAVTTETPGVVMERAETACASNNTFTELDKELQNLKEKIPRAKGKLLPQLGLFKTVGANEGAVACLSRGTETPASARQAISHYFKTGELGAIGKLRYFYARKSPDGSTEVFSILTPDSFNVSTFFGETKDGVDSPGHDPSLLSRPPESTRIFQADIVGKPYSVSAYVSKKSLGELTKHYDHEFDERGFIAFPLEGKGSRSATYTKENVQVVMDIESDPDGTTSVIFAEAGTTARVSVR